MADGEGNDVLRLLPPQHTSIQAEEHVRVDLGGENAEGVESQPDTSAQTVDRERQVIDFFMNKKLQELKNLFPLTTASGSGCNVDWKKVVENLRVCTEEHRDNILNTFKMMVKELPEVAREVLNGCVGYERLQGGKFEMVYDVDYMFLEESSAKTTEEDAEDHENPPINQIANPKSVVRYKVKRTSFSRNCTTLELISKGQVLLTHPVVMSYLRWKWKTRLAYFYFINLGLYLFYLACLSTFALSVHNPQDRVCTSGRNRTNGSTDGGAECDLTPGKIGGLSIVALFTIVFSCIRILLEFCELISSDVLVMIKTLLTGKIPNRSSKWEYFRTCIRKCVHWEYFMRPQKVLGMPLYIFSIIFSLVLYEKCLCPNKFLWQIGIVTILMAWINLLLFLNKWPLLGKYIAMFEAILRRFLKILIIAMVLIVAFSLAFFMALHEPDLPDTPFENPQVTIVETISQVIGSPDFSIFRLFNDTTEHNDVPFLVLSFIIWIVFGVVISVLFLTFLTALAVHDVAQLKLYGKNKRAEQLIAIYKEVKYFEKGIQYLRFCRKCCKCYSRNQYPMEDNDSSKQDQGCFAARDNEPYVDVVSPESRLRLLSAAVGVDNINPIISEFEKVMMQN